MTYIFFYGKDLYKVASEIIGDTTFNCMLDESDPEYKLEKFLDLYQKSTTSRVKADFFLSSKDVLKRKEIANQMPSATFINIIHPSAIISSDVKIGVGNLICAGVVIEPGCEIGNHCIIGANCTIGYDCKIGNFINVGIGSTIGNNNIINDLEIITPGMIFLKPLDHF